MHLVVSDDGPGLLELPDESLPSMEAEGGRGLFLVRRFCLGVELVAGSIGTTIRCWLPVEGDVDELPHDLPEQATQL